MANGGRLGARNVPGVDGVGGVWSLREIADARRAGAWWDWIDLFEADSTGLYTQIADANGTWAIASGELTATGGTQALFTRTGVSLADVAGEADVNYAGNGGIALRVANNSNYYFMSINDDSGIIPSENVQIYKRVAGAFTKIAAADVTWARGTQKTFRFEAVGTALKGYVDGVQMMSITDSSHAGPGGIGMRNDNSGGGITKYQAFRYTRL